MFEDSVTKRIYEARNHKTRHLVPDLVNYGMSLNLSFSIFRVNATSTERVVSN